MKDLKTKIIITLITSAIVITPIVILSYLLAIIIWKQPVDTWDFIYLISIIYCWIYFYIHKNVDIIIIEDE